MWMNVSPNNVSAGLGFKPATLGFESKVNKPLNHNKTTQSFVPTSLSFLYSGLHSSDDGKMFYQEVVILVTSDLSSQGHLLPDKFFRYVRYSTESFHLTKLKRNLHYGI